MTSYKKLQQENLLLQKALKDLVTFVDHPNKYGCKIDFGDAESFKKKVLPILASASDALDAGPKLRGVK